ncbi:retrotransposon protein, putative, ty1-copia subclass [Tanacetum coccineum]
MTTSVENNSVFRSFFEKQKLTGPNFIDWYRQLRLVLSTEDKEKYLEQPIPAAPVAAAPDQPIPPQALATYNEWVKNQKEIAVMMLLTIDLEIQRNLAHLDANDMLTELKALYSKQANRNFFKLYIDQLERLGHPVTLNLGTLPKKVVAPALHAIRAGKVQKNKNKKPSKAAKGVQGKGKGKKAYANVEPSYAPKPKNPLPPKKDNPAKDAICHHYGEVGHWRRNCPTYLTELPEKKKLSQGASTLGSKKLNPGALSLYMGNGQRAVVEAIGNYHLCLPSGLVIVTTSVGLSNKDKEKYPEKPILAALYCAPDQQSLLRAMTIIGVELKALYSKQAEQELLQNLMREFTCAAGGGHSRRRNALLLCLSYMKRTLPKKVAAPALHAIRAGKVQKNKNKKPFKAAKGVQGKGKGKKAYANAEPSYTPKPKNPPPPKRDNPAKDAICHHCGEVGCGTHICNITQGLRGSKKLNPGALSLYMGNGQRAAVEAIGNYHLCLPSGLVIVLNNCHYAPSITRGIISVSRLYEDGFINRFKLNNAISVSKNNVVYFSAILRDGVYEIEMSCSNTNDSSMYVVSNKRAKLNLDSSLLWHCRLGHISKKRIEKLQHDGLLNSTDIESLGKCVSCMSGKMARKPYSHQVERAKDLLGLIHTDVCGPFRIVSRQGANYFVTFTDDFSRYGYVYLLKHKHEVFETFKVFQKEVENQLGKTIKSLRSDRGGEYMSQEFLDHLKEHGIIAHRTPPYTPQHNGVSERRNRTLLDMVRSMMSQTTLPKSFWDYALESAARILNMVPTKKGCEALVKRDTLTKPDKLQPRSFKCIFIGYPKETMGYSFYNPSKNKVFVARNAELFESNLIDQEASRSVEDLEIIQEEDTNPFLDTSLNHEEDDQEIDEPQSDINPIHRYSRTKHIPDRMCLYIDAEEHEFGDLGEPANYKAALLDPESKK